MLGVTLKVDEKDTYLDLTIDPTLIERKLDAKSILESINNSEFKHFFIFEQNIAEALNNYKIAVKTNSDISIFERIGERRQTETKCKIARDLLEFGFNELRATRNVYSYVRSD